jgi:hypothetical protein
MDFFFVIWGGILAFILFKIIKHIRDATRLRKEGIKTIGVVIGSKIRWGRTTTVHPRIQFTTQLGDVIEVEGHTGISIPVYSKGEKVIVYYETTNPKNFTLDSNFERATPYLMIFLVAVMIAIFIGQHFAE